MPLMLRWLWRILCLTFQAVKGLRPDAVNDLFVHQCHTYTRGQASSSVLPPRTAHVVARRSFSFRASLLWNALPCAVRDVASLAAFKGLLASFSMSVIDYLVDIAFSNLSN